MRILKTILIIAVMTAGIAGVIRVDMSYAELTGDEAKLCPRFSVTDELLSISVCGRTIEIERNFIFESKK